jgi:type I restriction enzyme S subunit
MIDGLKPYPAMKDTGLPWLGAVPEHWGVRRNGRLFGARRETDFSDLPILEVSIRTGVRVRDVADGARKQEMADRSKYQRAVRGDIAYNMMRMWQGAVGIAPVDGLVSPAYVVARPSAETDAAYYAYLFRTAVYLHEIDTFSRGIVPDRNRLYWESFKQMPSLCPPLDEQRLIVRFLDWFGAQTVTLIRAKEGAFKLVAEEREVLTHDVMSSPGTQYVRLDVITDLIARPVSRIAGEAYTPVGLFNRGRGIFLKRSAKGDALGDSTFFWIEDGDLILSGQFAWEGAIALAGPDEDRCIASHRYHVLRGKEGVLHTTYLASFLRTSLGQMLLDEHSRGAAGRNRPLNIRALLKEKIPVPPQSEQTRLDEIVALEKQLARSITRFSERLREYRARLIADVVTGKLDVRAAAVALPDAPEIDEPDTAEAAEQDSANLEDAEAETEEAA